MKQARKEQIKIKDVYKGDDVSKKDAIVLMDQLTEVATMIPDKYKKNIPPITVIIRRMSDDAISCATVTGEPVIVLNLRKHKKIQKCEAFHEYVHMVERFNKKVMKISNDFLKSRLVKEEKVPLIELTNSYSKSESAANVLVYDGNFCDPYAGRTYGDLNPKKPVPTEVLSVGCFEWIFDRARFKQKDPEHYNLIDRLLKGKI